jgi:hypothetical protein
MVALRDLDPQIRCYVLVGKFLQAWSAMEIALHNTIGAALAIEYTKTQILCSNITFRDKTNILRTLVDVSSFTDAEKIGAKSKLRKLSNHATRRNMVAHNAFLPDSQGDGVEFMTTKAKGEYEPSLIVWTMNRFQQEERALVQYHDFLKTLEACFKKKPLTQQNYTSALLPFLQTDWPVPTPRTVPIELLRSHTQPVPVPPDSGQANEETSPQRPDKPQEGGQ